jgi:benzoate 4-monooxygenase
MTFNDKYGSVVKLGPSSLLISDKAMLKQVLELEDLEKGPMYDLLKSKFVAKSVEETNLNQLTLGDGAASLLITRDKGMHKRLRLLISPAFSLKYLESLEEHILNVLNNMMLKIEGLTAEHPQEGADVDIWKLLQHNALDIIGDCAFGKSFDTIKSDYHPVTDSIMVELRWASWVSMIT